RGAPDGTSGRAPRPTRLRGPPRRAHGRPRVRPDGERTGRGDETARHRPRAPGEPGLRSDPRSRRPARRVRHGPAAPPPPDPGGTGHGGGPAHGGVHGRPSPPTGPPQADLPVPPERLAPPHPVPAMAPPAEALRRSHVARGAGAPSPRQGGEAGTGACRGG